MTKAPKESIIVSARKSGLLSRKALADKLNVSTRTISRFINKGVPHIKNGRFRQARVYFDYKLVIKWLKKNYPGQKWH